MAVNLSPVGGVAAQFFTNTGAVLTGGKIYTYAAGTTTPAITYTSASGSTAWTNPIVLDAAGRVSGSGEIWLTDGISYKFVLKDITDVLIATYDNISGINSNFVAYTNQQEIITATAGQTVFDLSISYQPGTNSLSVFVDGVNQYGPGASYAYTETDSDTVTFASGLHVGAEVKFTTTQQQGIGVTDASQVSYEPPFTGGVATNVEAKLAQIISVKDFGAVGNGVADDTAAIQAGIDAVIAQGGGKLTIPAGKYLVSATLNIKGTNSFILEGDGAGDPRYALGYEPNTMILSSASVGISLANTGTGTSRTNGVVLRDFSLKQVNEANLGIGIDIPTGATFHGNFRFENIAVNYFETGLYARFVGWLYLDKSTFQYNTNGVDIVGNIINATDCLFYQNGAYTGTAYNNMTSALLFTVPFGVKISANAASFQGCDFENNGIGVLTYSDPSLVIQPQIDFTSCYFEAHSKQSAAFFSSLVTMTACYNNNNTYDKFYFEGGQANLNSSIKLNVINSGCNIQQNGCFGYVQDDIIYRDQVDYTTALKGSIISWYGIPDHIKVNAVPNDSFRRQFVSDSGFTASSSTVVVNAVSNNPMEGNVLSITATSNGGHGRRNTIAAGALTSGHWVSMTFVFRSTEYLVGIRLVDNATGSAILEFNQHIMLRDINNISTVQLWVKGLSASGITSVWVYPGGTTGNNGIEIEVLASSYISTNNNPVYALPIGAPDMFYTESDPAAGFHAQGEKRMDALPTAGGYIGNVCTSSGTPGTWRAFGAIL